MRPLDPLARPNRYDVLAGAVALSLLCGFLLASREAVGPYHATPISLDPRYLPEYALRTAFRMGVALFFPPSSP